MYNFRITPIVKQLLVINIIVFVITSFNTGVSEYLHLGRDANYINYKHSFQPFQLITYQFAHGGFWHLFGNMLLLFFLGPIIEEMWGSRRFIVVYLVAGVVSGLLHISFSPAPVVGASGSIFAIFTAFALYYPDQELYIWGVFPVKIKWLFLFHLITTLIGINPTIAYGDSVSHWAHLGGIIVGTVYVKIILKGTTGYGNTYRPKSGTGFTDSMSSTINNLKNKMQGTSSKNPNMKYSSYNDKVDANKLRYYRKVVDELLDKINTVGYLKLTDDERRRLEEASDYLKKFDSH